MVINGNYETVLEGFEQKFQRARFFEETQFFNRFNPTQPSVYNPTLPNPLPDPNIFRASIDILGSKVDLSIMISLCPRGKLGVDIWREIPQDSEVRVRLRGKIQVVETNASATFEPQKLGGKCEQFNGRMVVGDVINCSINIGGDIIPERATIRFEFEFLPFHDKDIIATQNENGISQLKLDIAALRENTETADVKIICNGMPFLAHIAILSARSDVFASLFRHKGTKEDISGEVHVEACDIFAMEMFLKYLYEETPPPEDVTFGDARQP